MSEYALIPIEILQKMIFTIRGVQVMIDRDLAELYQVENKRLNEQVKRNSSRFPETFRFQLTDSEKKELVANCDRFEGLKHSSVNPYAFTEQGVSMLSAVLRSETAIQVSIRIINAFVEMRKFLVANASLFERLETVEKRQLSFEIKTDENFEKVFKALESQEEPRQGIFYNGQVFDAYTFAEAHDRFLISDESTVYHIGASLKDLGKKWFAFSKFEKGALEMLGKLEV